TGRQVSLLAERRQQRRLLVAQGSEQLVGHHTRGPSTRRVSPLTSSNTPRRRMSASRAAVIESPPSGPHPARRQPPALGKCRNWRNCRAGCFQDFLPRSLKRVWATIATIATI